MALHKREQIMAAFTTALTGLATTGSNVTRARVYSIDDGELPHLSIFQGDDEPESPDGEDEATNIYLINRFNAHVLITSDASDGVLETEINQICKEIIVALMDDTTLGGLSLNVVEISTSRPDLSGEREKRTASTELLFYISYKRTRLDPSV